MEDSQLHPNDHESHQRDPGESPIWGTKGVDHEEKNIDQVLFSKTRPLLNSRHIISCCTKVSAEINARHDIVVNIYPNNILVQRGLLTLEQKWEDLKMVRADSDEIPPEQNIGCPMS